ncbi:MAG: hypothetical protein ACYSWW_08795 [Planctomycetota bacterium]|jgi:hypothetical protein
MEDAKHDTWQQWNWKKSRLGYYSTFEVSAIGEEARTKGSFGNI